MLTEKRISHLLDMMIQHVIHDRHGKAVRIGQYLRDHFGMQFANINPKTGYSRVGPTIDGEVIIRKRYN